MKRTLCLYIDAEVAAEARKLAEELGISLSQLAEEALAIYTAALTRRTRKPQPQQRQPPPQQPSPQPLPPLPPPAAAAAPQPPSDVPAFLRNNAWVTALRNRGS
jgi:pyruvate/2-oxoglutarate dehydrogenase complex dihydrolipoamide acyltransferase (E2) component